MSVAFAVAGEGVCAEAGPRVLFADTFQASRLAPDWQVIEGDWRVEDGALTNSGGGLIVLNTAPGGRFVMEFEIRFPSNWMSVIPFFTAPEDYGTLYFANGYWESFEMHGKELADYIQRRDAEIVTGTAFHRLKVVSEYGLVSFLYDGKAKGPAVFLHRPGARVAFRSLPGAGILKIRNFRLGQLGAADVNTVYRLQPADLVKGVVYQDVETEGKPGDADRLTVGDRTGNAGLTYAFTAGAMFESCFVRIPVDVARSQTMLMDVEGDGSRNSVFVIVHDASGEQHLVITTALAWSGWQEVGINLRMFLESPAQMERRVIHWDGDGNQRIDFPVRAVDIGVAKRGSRVADRGQVRFRSIRFLE